MRVAIVGLVVAAVAVVSGGWLVGEEAHGCFAYASLAIAPISDDPDVLALRDVPEGVESLGSGRTSGSNTFYDWRQGDDRYSTVVSRSADGARWEYPSAPHCRPQKLDGGG